jgi:hypothetical protein
MTKLMTLFILIALVSCGQKKNNKSDETKILRLVPFELTIIDTNGSEAYSIQYVLTDKNLKIFFKGSLEGEKDTTLFLGALEPNETLKTLSDLNIDTLKNEYINPCIKDGSQISVIFKKNNLTKTIHLSNFYQSDIGFAIQLINKLTPEKHKIWYDKEKLLKGQLDCEEAMKK